MGLLAGLTAMGPALHEAGKGAALLSTNLGGIGTALTTLGQADDSVFDKLQKLDELISRTQSKPIIVEVGGDVGGTVEVDFKNMAKTITVSDLSDDFVTEITRKISNELSRGNYGRSETK